MTLPILRDCSRPARFHPVSSAYTCQRIAAGCRRSFREFPVSSPFAPPTASGPLIAPAGGPNRSDLASYALPALAALVVGVFFLAPWSFEDKARAALHGLCAQTPSHSFALGERRLPFDARMTGIYGGFLVTAAYLLLRGRTRVFGLPPLRVLAALGLFVVAMAVDGLNSFLLDLQVWHAYAPQNDLRLATGLLTGIALATVVWFLVGSTLWRDGHGDPKAPPVGGLRELALVVVLQAPFALLVRSGASWAWVPLAVALLASAVFAVGAILLVIVVLLRRQDATFTAPSQLRAPAAAALLLAFVAMAAIAGARYWLEATIGLVPPV